jgi:hypothetical protein
MEHLLNVHEAAVVLGTSARIPRRLIAERAQTGSGATCQATSGAVSLAVAEPQVSLWRRAEQAERRMDLSTSRHQPPLLFWFTTQLKQY